MHTRIHLRNPYREEFEHERECIVMLQIKSWYINTALREARQNNNLNRIKYRNMYKICSKETKM